MTRMLRVSLAIVVVAMAFWSIKRWTRPGDPAGPRLLRQRIEIVSTKDGITQHAYLSVPSGSAGAGARPLLVLLHTWSNDFEQRELGIEAEARARGWLLLVPDFRGPNDHREACGSDLAQQDVLDAVAWVSRRYPVDDDRVYLAGHSGGGFMTMLMVARHPGPWAAASAWCGISDLREWYREHQHDDYGRMMRACIGGGPADTPAVDAEYQNRSPITHLRQDVGVPFDLGAGINDPVVSVAHTVAAFRRLAPGAISDADLSRLTADRSGRLSDLVDASIDPLIGRRVFRRVSGSARLTVFDGAHEWFPRAAVEWLSRHRREHAPAAPRD